MRLLLALLLAAPLAAQAQVSTNDQALQGLEPSAKPASPARKAPPKPSHAATHPAPRHAAPLPSKRLPATPIPPAPPVNPVVLPPPPVLPTHKPPPPPPVPVKADAPGEATALDQNGTRLTFGAGGSLLNPGMVEALHAVAAKAKADPTLIVAITAFAPGPPDDPSTPRRLSLDRALAARAVLINDGIASERIRAVANGETGIGDAPADRADIQLVKAQDEAKPGEPPAGKPAGKAPTP